ncbi:MAG TPA: UvrD-helicase domain-containing protein [Bryobacteraceae bacterium]|nr:UvrD-helicase domain-containing protein [Bryobacteraceae bacterium]
MDFLQGLNPQQREAVEHTEGPLLILAGAGSGKTRVITHRIARIIRHLRVPPFAVLAVTFTNKAAEEMRNRVNTLLEGAELSSAPNVFTFHSFCVRMLRRDGDALAGVRPGFKRNFTIYDDDDQLVVIKSAFRHVGATEEFMKYRQALSIISDAKSKNHTPQDFYKRAAEPKMSKLAVIYDQYENALRQANALDFDDLLLESVRLLRHDEATRESYNRRLSYIMIDEYQDTNRTQYELMRLLTQKQQNICVVGDEDQSIYSWRGADIRNILDFEHDYPSAKCIRLEQNYRSTKRILEAAGAVVANNLERKGKTLWTDSGAGELINVYAGFDGENEALFIADSIETALRENPGARVAVLYRTNSQSRQIEEALRRYNRPYLVIGGFSYYQRAEVKDAVAYVKLAVSPQDSISLLRVINTPARGIGKTTVEQIEEYAQKNNLSLWDAMGRMMGESLFPARAQAALTAFRSLIEDLGKALADLPLHDALAFLFERTGYVAMLEQEKTPAAESRIENLKELVNAAAETVQRGEGVTEFLDHAALVADSDSLDGQAQVSLMTLHNAKGLEFPIVFLAGMEDGLFPHSRSKDSPDLLEEERRLCYVGMTRAEKRLYLSWARSRRKFGGGQPERTLPSRFLKEIPGHLIYGYGASDSPPKSGVDLTAEQHHVRETVKKTTYPGKTYNSLENISQFFADRGIKAGGPPASPPRQPAPAQPAAKPQPPSRNGTTVIHPKFGRGVIVRREGEGEDAKLTISFPGHGLKKMVEKYAGLKRD